MSSYSTRHAMVALSLIMSCSRVPQDSRFPTCLSQLPFLMQFLIFGILADDLLRFPDDLVTESSMAFG